MILPKGEVCKVCGGQLKILAYTCCTRCEDCGAVGRQLTKKEIELLDKELKRHEDAIKKYLESD